jgi:hypothetical protein
MGYRSQTVVAGFRWNQWQLSPGSGGRLAVESMAGFTWKWGQLCCGIRIGYLRDRHGLSYREACERLGHPLAEPSRPAAGRPTPKAPPPALPPGEAWQVRAAGFVTQCEHALWSPAGAQARGYLRGRGLADDTLRAARVGYHAEGRREPSAAWGLTSESAPKEVWLPPGIVFPWWSSGALWRVTFRRLAAPGTTLQALGRLDGDRHFTVRGSANLLYRVDDVQANRPAMLVEAPLDALSIAQEAGDLVAAVAAGTSWGRLERWIGRLSLASVVLLGFDADDAGDHAAAWWQETLGTRARRWRPYWDDPSAMLQSGVDLRTWVREGLGREPRWWREVAAWPDVRREAWAERAAIVEVEAGYVRYEAERTAYLIAGK